jgi:hypothetical protein
MAAKYGLGSQTNIANEDNMSPMYADATDTSFYFTLERSSPEITNTNEGDYVVVIPDNIYDKPEEDETHAKDVKSGSQFYFTLEECSEDENESNEELSDEKKENKDETGDETCENGVQNVSIEIEKQDEINNDDTYVINIPNDVNGGGSKEETTAEDEEIYVIEIPKDENDLPSPEIKVDGYSGQPGEQEDNAATQTRVNSRSKEDEFRYDYDEIYENVNECLHVDNDETEAHKDAENFEQKTANSEENMGYLDDEILTQNKSEENATDNDNPRAETLLSDSTDCCNDNSTRNEDECYDDDDIYEDWEDNIIGRIPGESGEDLNECGDDMDPKNDFDIIKDQPSDCFYENLRHFRSSLVVQEIR